MSQVDQVAVDVLEHVIANDGEVTGEAGTVLKAIAEATGNEYKAVSVAVLYLERMGFVQVARKDEPESRRANRIEGVYLV